MAGVHIRALTTRHPIRPTSSHCHSAWQPNPGRGSTYRRGESVQTTGTSSDLPPRSSVYDYFDLWTYDGTLERIHYALYEQCRERAQRGAAGYQQRRMPG